MNDLNPIAVYIVVLATAIGALFGAWLYGLIVGLAVVLLATFLEA